ncbi:MAG: DUF3634 family protein [Ferruginibacter sp.]
MKSTWFSFIAIFLKMTSPRFMVTIKKGAVMLQTNTASNRFFTDCRQVLNENGIRNGIVYVSGRSNVLKAMGDIDKGTLQRLRNVWGFHR